MAAPSYPTEFTLPRQWHTNRKSPVRWLFSHAARNWYLILFMLIGSVSNAVLAAVPPILIGQAFNAILETPPNIAVLGKIGLLIAVTQIVRALLQLGRNFSAELTAQRVERDIRDELYISLLGKSMTFHSLQPIGDTMARATNDVREVNFLFNPGLNLVIGSAIFMPVPLVLAQRYDPSLMIIPAIFIILYFVFVWQYLVELKPITTELRSAIGNLNTRLAEALDGIETVKGMAQENQEVGRFADNTHRVRDAAVHQGYVEARFIPVLLLGITLAAGLFQALILYARGTIDAGDVVAYFGLLNLFGFPTFISIWAYSQISLGVAGAGRILNLINRENNLDQNTAGFSGPMRGEVEFRDVCFEYNGSEPALENITFKVKPGQTMAIVGQTGEGKTTLVKLINRTYDTTQGQVFVDGIDVRQWNLETLRRNISIIEQDIFLFSRTISENIAFGKQSAIHEEIEDSATKAQAHEFIASFNEGYDTVIGERGVTLSGGQRQRLALARAFLTDPKIMVLDDSTSSIDSATEDKIQHAIFTASRGRTTFIITHRLSQIRWADMIIVLRHGQIAAIGKHEDLMISSPAYRHIFTDEHDQEGGD